MMDAKLATGPGAMIVVDPGSDLEARYSKGLARNPVLHAHTAIVWFAIGTDPKNPRTRLLADVTFLGQPFFLEAIEVEESNVAGGWIETGVCEIGETRLSALCEEFECAFATTEIEGRQYVVVMTPHSR